MDDICHVSVAVDEAGGILILMEQDGEVWGTELSASAAEEIGQTLIDAAREQRERTQLN